MSAPETRRCPYCRNGTVWGGGIYAPRRTCLVCKGAGVLPIDDEGDE